MSEAEGSLNMKVAWPLTEPRLAAYMALDSSDGTLSLTVYLDGNEVLTSHPLGIVTDAGHLTQGLKFLGETSRTVTEQYTTLVGKRRERTKQMAETTFSFVGEGNRRLDIVVRVADDGVAYRYVLPDAGPIRILRESAEFRLPPDHVTWLQKYSVNYEQLYVKRLGDDVPAGDYAYPALFQVDDTFVLITEADLDGRYCGSRLVRGDEPDTYRIELADEQVEADGPLHTPWRVAIIGDLAAVAESTLVDDLAPPAKVADTSWIKPGRVAWSWLAGFGGAQSNFATQQRFVDYAAAHGWEYVLVDDGWKGQAWIPDLVAYAEARGVSIMLWVHWSELKTQAQREQLLNQVRDWGVVGLKIDFMDSDSQERYKWYDAVLQETAARQLLVNFHGSTIPHGIHRTWPHVMTMEAVRGAEHTNLPPDHIVTLPLTRNVLGSMDYTPMSFQFGIRNISDGGELALSVLFESGLQHYAGSIEVYRERPELERFLEQVPAVWDETRLISASPGQDVIMARRHGKRWFIGGLFVGDGRKREVPCSFLEGRWLVEVVRDGDQGFVRERHVIDAPTGGFSVDVASNGGFAAIACPWEEGIESCDEPVARQPLTQLEVSLNPGTADPGQDVEVEARFAVEAFGPVKDVTIRARAEGSELAGADAHADALETGQALIGTWKLVAPSNPDGSVTRIEVFVEYKPTNDVSSSKVLSIVRELNLVARPRGVHYVSDLPFVSSSNGYGPIERDMANGGRGEGDGPPLKIRGTTYYKGVGTHAPSEVVIDTKGAYERFTAWVGVDDSRVPRGSGSVAFKVIGDGKVLVETDVLTVFDPAHRIDVGIAGVQRLTLQVTDGGDGIANDHANWAGAQLHLRSEP